MHIYKNFNIHSQSLGLKQRLWAAAKVGIVPKFQAEMTRLRNCPTMHLNG